MQDVAPANRPDPQGSASVYRHSKRADWGLALLLWEGDGKRGLQFEDGQIRVIAEDYYGLLEQAQGPDPQVVETLAGMAARSGHQTAAKPKRRKETAAPPTVDDQLALFLERFPEGFQSPQWVEKHRGGKGRRLKRHRQPAIDEANELLARDALDACIAEGRPDDVRARWVEVLSHTDSVSKAHLEPLSNLEASADLGAAIRAFFHGEASIAERFDSLLQELGKGGARKISWPLLTAGLTLLHPTEQVCVRPSVFEEQARGATAGTTSASTPDGERYQLFVDMGCAVRDRLTELGHPPRDSAGRLRLRLGDPATRGLGRPAGPPKDPGRGGEGGGRRGRARAGHGRGHARAPARVARRPCEPMRREAATIEAARVALTRFEGAAGARVGPFGRGLIHDTFAVECEAGLFVLQRVHPVFAPEVHLDIAAVTEHLAAKGITTPRLRATLDGRPWAELDDGTVWRLMTRLPGHTFDAVASPAQARLAAGALGRFHRGLADLEHEFVARRAGVHDTARHLAAMRAAVAGHRGHRLRPGVERLAEALEAGVADLPALEAGPERVAHGDPKLNNVLFEAESGPGAERAVAMIDLDTVGPMALGLELGDAWRSWCNPRGEDEAAARFDLAVFEASLRGWADVEPFELAAAERRALVHGVEWITLELAARFAADALAESYFGWDWERYPAAGEHNLVRARGQWSLHQRVLECRPARAELVATVLGGR